MGCSRRLTLGLALLVCGCHTEPWIPANVVHANAHSSGAVLAFSGDSSRLASGGKDGSVSVWGLPEGAQISGWRAHERSVTGLGFVGSDLVSSGFEGTLALWDEHSRLIGRESVGVPIQALAVSADRIALAQQDGVMSVWTSDGGLRRDGFWDFGAGPLLSVAVHEDRAAAAGTGDGQVFLVSGPGGDMAELEPAPGAVWTLEFTPDGERLSGAGWFKVFHWDLASGEITVLETPHYGLISGMSYLNDNRTLATISRQTDSQVFFLDADTGVETARFQPHDLCGSDVSLSRDGRFLASTSDDASVRIWDRDNPRPLQSAF